MDLSKYQITHSKLMDYHWEKRKTKEQPMLYRQVELMRLGYKKSVLTNIYKESVKALIGEFPSVVFNKNIIMFFQDEKTKSDFVDKAFKNYKVKINHTVIGEFLGYPPSAIETFGKIDDVSERRGICYHGIQFVTHKDDVANSLTWLSENCPIKEEHKTSIDVFKFITPIFPNINYLTLYRFKDFKAEMFYNSEKN